MPSTHLAATFTRKGTLPAPSTIERAPACIQSRHKKAGLPLNAESARLALRDYRRERSSAGHRGVGERQPHAIARSTDPVRSRGAVHLQLVVFRDPFRYCSIVGRLRLPQCAAATGASSGGRSWVALSGQGRPFG